MSSLLTVPAFRMGGTARSGGRVPDNLPPPGSLFAAPQSGSSDTRATLLEAFRSMDNASVLIEQAKALDVSASTVAAAMQRAWQAFRSERGPALKARRAPHFGSFLEGRDANIAAGELQISFDPEALAHLNQATLRLATRADMQYGKMLPKKMSPDGAPERPALSRARRTDLRTDGRLDIRPNATFASAPPDASSSSAHIVRAIGAMAPIKQSLDAEPSSAAPSWFTFAAVPEITPAAVGALPTWKESLLFTPSDA